MKKFLKIIIPILLIIYIIIILFINVESLQKIIIGFFAPKSFNECLKVQKEIFNEQSKKSCTWDASNYWLIGKFCNHEEGMFDPKCRYVYLNFEHSQPYPWLD
ncbi:MAG: hypothetical protein UR27_C0024G0008 [Candidatus Peregrinibacteria bacterium GW2011_GWA2_33_10]|nr:MAG: hypothetical protein UR27_C0024G0008 [Candidatus Peregrinibacteria bacterium GW2011_GWA2_33_10]KKP38300.1 MAG: hypothetical protein UR30_C0021G0008 [Candidatus Peregrinibacteria bacterium GW2011_GWC2_33_13]